MEQEYVTEQKKYPEVRVRMAPSPTGKFHIGNARTALFNYLFAVQNKGVFVLRIEDTDTERSKPEFEKDIIDSLKWLGIEWSEGPVANNHDQKLKARGQKYVGNYGPYRQSERLPLYRKYLEKLFNEGKAYYCFCTKEELEAKKQYQVSIGEAPKYDGKCKNLFPEAVKKYLSENIPSVIRLKNSNKKVVFNDIIRGKVEFDTSLTGDFVIAKGLDSPLYNFAVVIDDFEMKISYVIRGEDHISNTPKQILIEEALGFNQPRFAHLPLILGPDKSKLSKRHAIVSVSEYRKDGYLPEAIVNFIAFLGWNPGTEREIYSMNSLIKEFSLEKVQKGGAMFNIKRLDYLNGFYIRQKSLRKLTELCIPYLVKNNLITPKLKSKKTPSDIGFLGDSGIDFFDSFIINKTKEEIDFDSLEKIISLHQERLKKLSEITELTEFFFKDKLEYPKDLLKWKNMSEEKEVKSSLDKLEKIVSKIHSEKWKKESIEEILLVESEKFKTGDRGYLLWPLRVSLTGKEASAGPFEVAEVLGREKTLKRIKEAKELFK